MKKTVKKLLVSLLSLVVGAGIVIACMQLFAPDASKPSNWIAGNKAEMQKEMQEGESASGVSPLSAVTYAAEAVPFAATPQSEQFKQDLAAIKKGIAEAYGGGTGSYIEASFNSDSTYGLNVKFTNNFNDTVYDYTGISNDSFACFYALTNFMGTMQKTDMFIIIRTEGTGFFEDSELNKLSVSDFEFFCPIYENGEPTEGEDIIDFAKQVVEQDEDFYQKCPEADGYLIYKIGTALSDLRINMILKKQPVPLPEDPVKEGYTFVGWYYDENLTQPYKGEPIYADTQLYAKFKIKQYSVTFDMNGGKYGNDGDSEVVKYIAWNTSAPLLSPTRKGYNFLGWFFEDGTEYTNQPVTSEITLYAHWKVIMFTVTFCVDGELYKTFEVEYGTSFAKLFEEAKSLNYAVAALYADDVLVDSENFENFVVTSENVVVELGELSTGEKIAQWFKDNMWYLIGGAGGVVVLVVVGVVVSRKKRG